MKRSSLNRYGGMLLAMFLTAMLAACSSGPRYAPVQPAPGRAVLYIYRPSALPAIETGFGIYLDGQKIGNLGNGEYMVRQVAPGLHKIDAQTIASNEASIDARPGYSYYIRVASQVHAEVIGPRVENALPHEGQYQLIGLTQAQ